GADALAPSATLVVRAGAAGREPAALHPVAVVGEERLVARATDEQPGVELAGRRLRRGGIGHGDGHRALAGSPRRTIGQQVGALWVLVHALLDLVEGLGAISGCRGQKGSV